MILENEPAAGQEPSSKALGRLAKGEPLLPSLSRPSRRSLHDPDSIAAIHNETTPLFLGVGAKLAAANQYLKEDLSGFADRSVSLRQIQYLPTLQIPGGRIVVGSGGVILQSQHTDARDRKHALSDRESVGR